MKFTLKISQVSSKKYNLSYFERSDPDINDIEINTNMLNYTVLVTYTNKIECQAMLMKFSKSIDLNTFSINKITNDWFEFTPREEVFNDVYCCDKK